MTVSILPTTSTDNDPLHGASHTMSQDLEATKSISDDASDYGDFTLDEQEIIQELLANIAPGNATAEEPLELTDIEDYEEPRGVRLPKTLGKELWVPPWMQQQARAGVTIQAAIEDQTPRDVRTTTNGKSMSLTMVKFSLTC
jgi:hypothetical protein